MENNEEQDLTEEVRALKALIVDQGVTLRDILIELRRLNDRIPVPPLLLEDAAGGNDGECLERN